MYLCLSVKGVKSEFWNVERRRGSSHCASLVVAEWADILRVLGFIYGGSGSG